MYVPRKIWFHKPSEKENDFIRIKDGKNLKRLLPNYDIHKI